jgi:2-keto-4-pentenoate hydratase/2-oxohepta-3-ene-1,7-dioic acid hydratase in catechol pathway
MKIICIGRNYVEHAKELKNPLPKEPVFFLKPDTALLIKNRPFFYPEFSENIHFETEIVLKISKTGKYINKKFATTYFDEIGLGIDFTARDIQQQAKEKGLPWEKAKAFDYSAPLSDEFIPVKKIKNIDDIRFHLDVNGKTVQSGTTADMIFSFADIVSYVSQYMTLRTGDLIFTGTPAGVGPVRIGDVLEGYIEEKRMLRTEIR